MFFEDYFYFAYLPITGSVGLTELLADTEVLLKRELLVDWFGLNKLVKLLFFFSVFKEIKGSFVYFTFIGILVFTLLNIETTLEVASSVYIGDLFDIVLLSGLKIVVLSFLFDYESPKAGPGIFPKAVGGDWPKIPEKEFGFGFEGRLLKINVEVVGLMIFP